MNQQAQRLVLAMAVLVTAGAIQELELIAGHPELGIVAVLPALAACAVLWRPSGEALAALLVLVGLELLLPLHTGGGRFEDWLLHYEISLNYAGLPHAVTDAFLQSRTALPQQLLGALLAHNSAYWLYQLGAVLLNGLWLWPAWLLVSPAGGRGRLLAVALAPFVLAYGVYTWPWGFAAFFLLAALWLASQPARLAAPGVGLALGGALLAHPGSAGYVIGAAAYIAIRQRRRALPALAAGTATLCTQLPWAFAITGGRGPLAVLASTDTVRQQVSPALWFVSRLELLAHSVIPFAPPVPGLAIPDLVLVFFVLSLPGALLVAWLLTGRWMRPPPAALWTVAIGALVSWAIVPPQQVQSGMLDALFLGVLVLLLYGAAQAPAGPVWRLLTWQAALGLGFAAVLLAVSTLAPPEDPNLDLKQAYRAVFLVQRFGVVPGFLVLCAGLLAAGQSAAVIRLRPRPGMPPT